jgi:hypothetical protein
MQPFDSYADLLTCIQDNGHTPQILGRTPDSQPIVAVKSGGDKTPAIFISAGSHATEQAGVSAACALIDEIETEHQLYTIPSRDPIGMNGLAYALGLGLDETPNLGGLADVAPLLKKRGEVLYEEGDTVVALIGEYGYATRNLYNRPVETWIEALKGRRLYFPASNPGVERAYTLVITPAGEVLHLNRFHDTPWAPVEPRCTRDLMAAIQPGLTLDLHEHGGDFFWFSARHQRTPSDQQWEEVMASEMIAAVAASDAALAPDNYLPGSFFTTGPHSVFWLNPQQRGEGLNLADFAAHTYGLAFTIETGMELPFAERVHTAKIVVQKAVEVFARRHAGCPSATP